MRLYSTGMSNTLARYVTYVLFLAFILLTLRSKLHYNRRERGWPAGNNRARDETTKGGYYPAYTGRAIIAAR